MTDAPDLTTLAGQRAHYAAVRRRLMGEPPPARMFPPTRPIPPSAPVLSQADIAQAFWLGVMLGRQMHHQEEIRAVFEPMKPDMIISMMCDLTGIRKDDLIFGSTYVHLLPPRHVGMFLMKASTTLSTSSVARQFGNRNHSTIVHAIQVIERKLVAPNPEISAAVAAVGDCREHGADMDKFTACLRHAATLMLRAYRRLNEERREQRSVTAREVARRKGWRIRTIDLSIPLSAP